MRRTVWLIWLCVALLPVRGMAHSLMLGAGASHGPAAVVQFAADASAPCPMHAGGPTSAAATPGSDAPAGAVCHLCAVCHGAALPTVAVAAIDAERPRTVPVAHLGLGTGRVAPDGLFRPPR